jgi:hypothetical protein
MVKYLGLNNAMMDRMMGTDVLLAVLEQLQDTHVLLDPLQHLQFVLFYVEMG